MTLKDGFQNIALRCLALCASLDDIAFEGYLRLIHLTTKIDPVRSALTSSPPVFISGIIDCAQAYTALPFSYSKETGLAARPGQPITLDDFLLVTHDPTDLKKRNTEKRVFKDYERDFFHYLAEQIMPAQLGQALSSEGLRKLTFYSRPEKRSDGVYFLERDDHQGFPREFLDLIRRLIKDQSSHRIYKVNFSIKIKPEEWGQKPLPRARPPDGPSMAQAYGKNF